MTTSSSVSTPVPDHDSSLIKSAAGVFPFLTLPFEIRQAIYRATLTSSSPISYAPDDSGGQSRRNLALGLNLLQVCRQIYREAHELVYLENTFELWPQSNWATDNFFEAMNSHPENARLVRRLHIMVKVELFHHIDYVCWPEFSYPRPFDFKKLKVVAFHWSGWSSGGEETDGESGGEY